MTLLLHYFAMVGGKVTPNFSYMRDYIPILELGNDVRGALASVVESRGGGNAAACVVESSKTSTKVFSYLCGIEGQGTSLY